MDKKGEKRNESKNEGSNESRDESSNESRDESSNESTDERRDESSNESKEESSNERRDESSNESKEESSNESSNISSNKSKEESIEDNVVRELERLLGTEILIVTEAAQLNLLGQTFRPIFVGPIVEVELGHLTIFPATIKIVNAPFFQFPTPLSIPLEKIAHFTPNFDSDTRFPLV